MDNKKKKIFSQLYDKCVDKIYRFVFLKVDSREIAEDLTSETFLRAWEMFRKPQFGNPNPHPVIENPSALFYKIAKNLVVDHYRQKGQFKIISTESVKFIPSFENLEERANIDLDMMRVREALSKLSDDYQEIIIWYYLNELSIPEIAKILEKSENAVRVTLSRALKELREKFD